MNDFKLESKFKPVTEQLDAVDKLVDGINKNVKSQVLLGVTGSGKTFTLANVIEKINRPTLVISHNKTLAAQLYSEFKEFFPHNAVEYFVSYYDYYQPEAYVPQTDIYIEKDSSVNDRLDRLRLSSTTALMSRRDVIIVGSVSCIYNLGSPQDYREFLLFLKVGQQIDRDEVLLKLINIQYERNDYDFSRGKIRVRGDTLEVYPAYRQDALRIQFFGEEIEKITQIEPVSGNEIQTLDQVAIYPAKHYIISHPRIEESLKEIEEELNVQLKKLKTEGKLAEAQRLNSRTRYDMEMLREMGYCNGIENYSRYLSGRPPGSRPSCLIDYFPSDFLTLIDESHVTIPQLNGMYEGDKARKQTLVNYGFRLPSCLDNRPLKFSEFESITNQTIYVSATPSKYEKEVGKGHIIEQIIRPTGIVDPPIEVRPTKGQVDDLVGEIKKRAAIDQRVLITTLTKRMSEDLTDYLIDQGLSVKYLHSDIDTIDRSKILKDLRTKKFDCLVGVNLLREGLDLPEVTLVAILDADKQGFLRSQTSLIQTAGRAARNIEGLVIMYADTMSEAMRATIYECDRRRKIQTAFNKEHNITPATIKKIIRGGIEDLAYEEAEETVMSVVGQAREEYTLSTYIAELEGEMEAAARNLQFEKAARIRDKILELKSGKDMGSQKSSSSKAPKRIKHM
ncbi:MAG: excinuclease ABC subunit UvrB [Candidatus Omnitrophica bacterium]|nr:excinuclease ABC subunit UvrB [Candidatus Omnitrophota bacterium]